MVSTPPLDRWKTRHPNLQVGKGGNSGWEIQGEITPTDGDKKTFGTIAPKIVLARIYQ
jgi:hypothetical protein